jgi:protein-disulfide isomerase
MSSQSQGRRGRRVQPRKSNRGTFIFWSIIGIVVAGAAAFLITVSLTGGFTPVDPIEASTVNAPVGQTDEGFWYKGDPEAPVQVFKYSDFQCPACANYDLTLGPVVDSQYVETGQVQFVYHDFPLQIHANSAEAHQASRCAGDQEMYWSYHDVLFQRQSEWSSLGSPTNQFVAYAGALGMDEDAFRACLNEGTYADAVSQAAQSAIAAQISATPTFVINGQQFNSSELMQAIEAALQANGQ